MDSASYFSDVGVMQAPLERKISDMNRSVFFLTPNSASKFSIFESRSTPVSSWTNDGAVKVELRGEDGKSNLTAFFGGDSSIVSQAAGTYISSSVKPLNDILLTEVRDDLKSICALDAVASESDLNSRLSLRSVVDAVEDYIGSEDLWSLNELLGSVNPSELRKITSVAFLRSSFRARENLSNWDVLYSKTFAFLEATNQDPVRALRGLARTRVDSFA